MVKTYLTFLEGSRYPCAQTCGSPVEADPESETGCCALDLEGNNGPTLPLSDVYYVKSISLRKGDHGRGSLLARGGLAPWG